MSGPFSPMTSTKDFPFSFAATNVECKSFACAYKKVAKYLESIHRFASSRPPQNENEND